jgi:hypothetical protein
MENSFKLNLSLTKGLIVDFNCKDCDKKILYMAYAIILLLAIAYMGSPYLMYLLAVGF